MFVRSPDLLGTLCSNDVECKMDGQTHPFRTSVTLTNKQRCSGLSTRAWARRHAASAVPTNTCCVGGMQSEASLKIQQARYYPTVRTRVQQGLQSAATVSPNDILQHKALCVQPTTARPCLANVPAKILRGERGRNNRDERESYDTVMLRCFTTADRLTSPWMQAARTSTSPGYMLRPPRAGSADGGSSHPWATAA